jgi:hypothetical protein
MADPSPLGTEPSEDRSLPYRPDQADSRSRPFARRDFTIAWPARVDMRWRKP